MKVYLTKPRDHWLSPYKILENVFFWREIDYDEPLIEKWSERLEPFCKAWQKFLDIVHPKVEYVKIDYWDTWSMDYTLSPIILPMLKQLQKTKHGSPCVDDEDVPEHLRSTSARPKENEWDTDELWHGRWTYVMDEMIWAFTQLCDKDNDSQFYDHSDVDENEKDLMKQVAKIKCDYVAYKAHNDRIQNGLKLFGKYYRALWD